MEISLERNQNDLTVIPVGRLDSTTSGELDRVLKQEVSPELDSLTIDLKDVDFISSLGLRVLVGIYRSLNGKPVYLIGANASVKEILRLSGMYKIFKVDKP